jgi:hypothetical protein
MKKITVYTYQTIGGYIVETVNKTNGIQSDTFLGTRTIELDEPQKVHSLTEEELSRAWERCGKDYASIVSSDSTTFRNFLKELGVK